MMLNNIIILMLEEKISIHKAIFEINKLKSENRINNSQLLHQLISFLHDNEEKEEFWNSLIFFIDPKAIDTRCFEYFVQYNVALEKLSHLKLEDEQLKVLAPKFDEACITFMMRLYNDSYSDEEFYEFISTCKNEYAFKYILSVPKQMNYKKQKLYDVIKNRNDLSEKLKAFAFKQYNSDILKNTDNISYIIEFFTKMEPEYLLSISKNINTPINILENLKIIQGVKYASIIRKNSLETLNRIN